MLHHLNIMIIKYQNILRTLSVQVRIVKYTSRASDVDMKAKEKGWENPTDRNIYLW